MSSNVWRLFQAWKNFWEGLLIGSHEFSWYFMWLKYLQAKNVSLGLQGCLGTNSGWCPWLSESSWTSTPYPCWETHFPPGFQISSRFRWHPHPWGAPLSPEPCSLRSFIPSPVSQSSRTRFIQGGLNRKASPVKLPGRKLVEKMTPLYLFLTAGFEALVTRWEKNTLEIPLFSFESLACVWWFWALLFIIF